MNEGGGLGEEGSIVALTYLTQQSQMILTQRSSHFQFWFQAALKTHILKMELQETVKHNVLSHIMVYTN